MKNKYKYKTKHLQSLFIIICFVILSYSQSTNFQTTIQTTNHLRILQSQPTCFTRLSTSNTQSNNPPRTTVTSGSANTIPFIGSPQGSQSSTPNQFTTKYDEFISSFKPPTSSQWDPSQYSYRSLIFQMNLQKINEHNMNQQNNFWMGVNYFCDLTQTQFDALYSKLIIPDNVKKVTIGLRQNIKNGITNSLGTEYSQLWNEDWKQGNYPAVNVAEKNKDKNLRVYQPSSSSSSSTSTRFLPSHFTSTVTTTTPSSKNKTTSTGTATTIGTATVTGAANGTATGAGAGAGTANTRALRVQSPILGSTSTSTSASTFLNAFATLTIPSTSTNSPASYTTPERIVIDWSCKASAIINQGICGSCFAIAPLQSIYMTLRIYNRTILPLSVQEVLSCTSSSNGAFGCGGGYFLSAFEYVRVNGTGRALLYPYNTRATNEGVVTACNTTLINSQSYTATKFRIRQSGFIPFNDCAELVNRLKIQPIAVSIATTNFQFYVNGTYNVAGEMPNHGVVLVGYDPQKGYKIKNSWGTAWGDAGYGYVSQTTGVCDYSMYPITGFQNTGSWQCC